MTSDVLATLPCPDCATVGSLRLGTRLRARPVGTWSLSGEQLKTSAVQVPVLECGVDGCGFVKFPSERGSP
jgi:hypothetical protein